MDITVHTDKSVDHKKNFFTSNIFETGKIVRGILLGVTGLLTRKCSGILIVYEPATENLWNPFRFEYVLNRLQFFHTV